MKRICVYCGSRFGNHADYRRLAADFGRLMAERDLGLVYGGGHVGLMGVVADAVLAHGGSVIGVITDYLVRRELAHPGLTELYVVDTMHERKAMMADLSDGFVALPGGYGTLDELFEIVTWAQLGLHAKPCAVLNTQGYFDALLAFVDHAAAEGFVHEEHRALLQVHHDPVALLNRFAGMETAEPRASLAAVHDPR